MTTTEIGRRGGLLRFRYLKQAGHVRMHKLRRHLCICREIERTDEDRGNRKSRQGLQRRNGGNSN